MEKASIKSLLRPQSIAIIGASSDTQKVGGKTIMFNKNIGYAGKIIPINPKETEIQGDQAYPSIKDVPGDVDMAILALPASRVIQTVEDCAAKGVKSVVIFSSGFKETGEAGRQMEEKIKMIAEESSMRILGPNTVGFINVRDSVVGSFTNIQRKMFPPKGRVGLVSQSGSVGTFFWVNGAARGIGLSYWIATGNEVDVTVADCVKFLAEDEETDVIAVQFEGTNNGESFRAALELAHAKGKPVVVLKGGSSEYGAKAAGSHTGNMVGSDAVYDTMFKQAGAYRASGMKEFLDVVYALSQVKVPKGKGIGVFSVSGGAGILIADELAKSNMPLPAPSPEAQKKMLALMPLAGVVNPIDVTSEVVAKPHLFDEYLEICAQDGSKFDMMLLFLHYEALLPNIAATRLTSAIKFRDAHPDVPLLVVSSTTEESHKAFVEAKIPVYEDAEGAVSALTALGYFAESRNRKICSKQSVALEPDLNLQSALTEDVAKALLSKYSIPVTNEKIAQTEDDAVAFAAEIGFPVVVKGMSPEILHKTEAGIVYLNVNSEEEVRKNFKEIVEKIKEKGANCGGVLIQEMITGGIEVIVGTTCDKLFGPTVMVGLGGIYTEVLKDTAIRLAPIELDEAEKMITELKAYPILAGARGAAKADTRALAQLLVNIGNFALRYQTSISDIDLNPVKVFQEGNGVKVVDALIIPAKK